jgi:XTP/dITP diphosphohydrolase
MRNFMDIVLATKNKNKLREFREMLKEMDVGVVSLDRFPDCPVVIEDGKSFAENAVKKARAVAEHTGHVSVADDSGLEVDFLGGQPGIYSARYAGEEADDQKNNAKLLKELGAVPEEKRGAQFKCVIAVVDPHGKEQTVEGTCRGVIITGPRGGHGFGYDPVFLDKASGLTFAEMTPEQKNRVSHRSRAIRELKKSLMKLWHCTGFMT